MKQVVSSKFHIVKNTLPNIYIFKVMSAVCLFQTLNPIILGLAEINGLKLYWSWGSSKPPEVVSNNLLSTFLHSNMAKNFIFEWVIAIQLQCLTALQTHTIRRGLWNLPHKFHIYKINSSNNFFCIFFDMT